MNGTRLVALACLLAVLAAGAVGAEPDWYYQHPDSMPRLGTNKLFYLEQKYGLCPRPSDEPESLNVRMVGKWGGGPSWGVTGKDTLVYLSRGSEVVVINFADTANPQILNHIQAKRLCGRPVLQDSLLYLATSGYIEVFNVSDPVNAERVGRLAVPVADIDVEDSLVYVIGADSFMVWSFADPGNPYLVGACPDSGYALDVDNGYAYLRDRWGMWILDATDPGNPHRIASWGTDIAGVKVRGNHCYVAQGQMGSNSLHVLNVSDPANPWQEGVLSGLTGEGIYLVDTLLFLPGFDVVNVADSSRPMLVGHKPVGGYEVWVDGPVEVGVTANWAHGMRVLDLSDITHPVLDTSMLAMRSCVDISVKGGVACVASQENYMAMFDVSDPAQPREIGRYTAPGWFMESVLSTESLAYVPAYAHTHDTVLHAVDITDPSNPVMVGAVGGWLAPAAMSLRDTLLYVAEDYKFEVFSVANPRQPVWLGNCDALYGAAGIDVQDTLVYVMPGFQVFNVARPDQPVRISSTSCNAWDIAIRDTFAYIAHARESLKVYSVANPYSPQQLSSTWVPGQARAVVLRDSYVYLGCDDFRVFDIANPVAPELGGRYSTPYLVMSLDSDSQYVYAACYLAGICILEQLPVGIAESRRQPSGQRPSARLSPNPVRRWARLELSDSRNLCEVQVYDPLGRVVQRYSVTGTDGGPQCIDFGDLGSGVYFLRCKTRRIDELVRFAKP